MFNRHVVINDMCISSISAITIISSSSIIIMNMIIIIGANRTPA